MRALEGLAYRASPSRARESHNKHNIFQWAQNLVPHGNASDVGCPRLLQEVSPPLDKRGFVLFFTGLSGSGKTTITSALIETLQSLFPTRQMTILDGDVVRTHLSKELGFSIQVRALVCADLDYR